MDVLSQVRIGMRVIDADGSEIGTVEEFQWGDPEAVTSEGQVRQVDRGMAATAARHLSGEGDLSEEGKELLLRTGFVKVDVKGLFRPDRFIAADRLDRVEDDVLYVREKPV